MSARAAVAFCCRRVPWLETVGVCNGKSEQLQEIMLNAYSPQQLFVRITSA